MSTTVLPTRTDGAQRYGFKISLGSVIFGLEFFWNLRDQSWSVQISDSSGNLLLSKKITLNSPLISRYASPTLPNGEFFAIDTSGANLEPGLTDLGSRVLLTFTDVADLAA